MINIVFALCSAVAIIRIVMSMDAVLRRNDYTEGTYHILWAVFMEIVVAVSIIAHLVD